MGTYYGPSGRTVYNLPSFSDPCDFNHDPVNAPAHYRRGGLEAISVIEAFELSYRLGNAVKYILRAGHKGDRLEDLRKAQWYLAREISRGEKAQAHAELLSRMASARVPADDVTPGEEGGTFIGPASHA